MEKMNQIKKTSIIFMGVVMLICLLTIIMSSSVNAAETIENVNLDEIFEVYNNAELEEGMDLAPNPNANDEEGNSQDLQEIFDVYNNTDLKEGQVLAPAPSENINFEMIFLMVILVALGIVGIVVSLKKIRNKN